MILWSRQSFTLLLVRFFVDEHHIAPANAQLPPPTNPPCTSGTNEFKFQMLTDNHGEDITWKLYNQDGSFNEYIGNGFDFGNEYGDNKPYQEKYCIPEDEW